MDTTVISKWPVIISQLEPEWPQMSVKELTGLGFRGGGKDQKHKWITVCVCVHTCSVMPNSFDPMDFSSPGSSVHGISQASVSQWVAISSSRVSSWPRNWTCVSCMTGRFFTIWAAREALEKIKAPKSGLQVQMCFFTVYCEGKTRSMRCI